MRLAIIAALAASPAYASSGDAWAQFRLDVGTACLALVEGPGSTTIEVNSFGSESYGVALVTLTSPEGADRMVCIYDKVTKKAELSAPFGH